MLFKALKALYIVFITQPLRPPPNTYTHSYNSNANTGGKEGDGGGCLVQGHNDRWAGAVNRTANLPNIGSFSSSLFGQGILKSSNGSLLSWSCMLTDFVTKLTCDIFYFVLTKYVALAYRCKFTKKFTW